MADNIAVLDGAGASKTVRTTDAAGVHTPHHIVASSALPTGAGTSANQDTIIAALAAIETAIEILDNIVSGNEAQVDVLTLPGVTGTVAAGAADSGNPVKVGGKYNATAPTLDDGDRGDLELDVNGNAKVVVGAVEVRSFHHNLGTDVDVSVKASAGHLMSVICGNTNAAARYFQVHNLAAAPGAAAVPVASWLIKAGETLILGADELGEGGMSLATGIAIGISTAVGSHTAATVAEHAWSVSYV